MHFYTLWLKCLHSLYLHVRAGSHRRSGGAAGGGEGEQRDGGDSSSDDEGLGGGEHRWYDTGGGGGGGGGDSSGEDEDELDAAAAAHDPATIDRGVQDCLDRTVRLMALDLPAGKYRASQQTWGVADDEAVAARFRESLHANARLQERVCCVCAVRCTADEMHPQSPFSFSSMQQRLEPLRTDLPVTERIPRNGSTRWTHAGVEYHLQPHAIQAAGSGAAAGAAGAAATPLLPICRSCYKSLDTNSDDVNRLVPRLALARCDVGLPPPWYEELTLAEQLLICTWRPVRHLVSLCNPAFFHTATDQRHKALHGHCVAFAQPGLGALAAAFPLPLDELPNYIHVVLVGYAATDEQARAQAEAMAQKGCPALRVNARKVLTVVARLIELMSRLKEEWRRTVHDGALAELEVLAAQQHDRVPDVLLRAATFLPNDLRSVAVLRAMYRDPVGYAQQTYDTPPAYTHEQLLELLPDNTAQVSLVESVLHAMRRHEQWATQRALAAAAEEDLFRAAIREAEAKSASGSAGGGGRAPAAAAHPGGSATLAAPDAGGAAGPSAPAAAAGGTGGADTAAAAAFTGTDADLAARAVDVEDRIEELLRNVEVSASVLHACARTSGSTPALVPRGYHMSAGTRTPARAPVFHTLPFTGMPYFAPAYR